MTKMRVKDMVTFDYSMGKIHSTNRSVEAYVNRPLEQAIERNKIMQDIQKLAWKMKIRSKESHRINWHYARRHKETIPQLVRRTSFHSSLREPSQSHSAAARPRHDLP